MKKVLTLVAVMLIIAGCGKDNTVSNDPTENGPPKYLSMNLTLEDHTNLGEPGFSLFFQSDALVDYCYYYYTNNLTLSDNNLRIDMEGVYEYDKDVTCLGVVMPAVTWVDLSELKNGEYNITINNGMPSYLHLVVTDSYYEIIPFITNKLDITNYKLER